MDQNFADGLFCVERTCNLGIFLCILSIFPAVRCRILTTSSLITESYLSCQRSLAYISFLF